MKAEIKKNGNLPEHIYERLDAVLDESQDPQVVASYILREFTLSEVETVIQILLENLSNTSK
jgi:hypothetical protein